MIRATNAKRTNDYKNAIHRHGADECQLSLEQIVRMPINNEAKRKKLVSKFFFEHKYLERCIIACYFKMKIRNRLRIF